MTVLETPEAVYRLLHDHDPTKPLPKADDDALPCRAHPEPFDGSFELGQPGELASVEAVVLCQSGNGGEECPMLRKCLAWAIKHNEHGVWGGTDEAQRRSLRRRYKLTTRNLSVHAIQGEPPRNHARTTPTKGPKK